jgi:hypothetical protein
MERWYQTYRKCTELQEIYKDALGIFSAEDIPPPVAPLAMAHQ